MPWASAGLRLLVLAMSLLPAAGERASAADASKRIDFNITAPDLAGALNQFAQQSDQQILFSSASTQGKRAPAVHGSYPPLKALDLLLQGSGLHYQVNGETIVVVGPGEEAGHTTPAAPLDVARAADAAASPPDPNASMPSAPTKLEGALAEVVVTARKRAEDMQRVPVSVTAFDGDQLKEQSVKTIADIQSQIPGLYLQQATDDPQSLIFTLRGRKQNDATLAVDSSVGLYVDGLYVPRTLGMQGSLLDIDRVEVLRGPQGTLYGRNTTGGAIAFYTNNPTDQSFGSIDLTGGNYGAWNVVGIANVPFTDTLQGRFVFQRGAHDGYGHTANDDSLLSEDSQYYRAKLRASWDDHWEAVLSAHYESNHSGGGVEKLVGLTPADPTTTDPYNPSQTIPEGGALTDETAAALGLSTPQAVALLESYVAKARSDFYDNGSTSRPFSNIGRWDVGLTINGDLPGNLQLRSITGAQHLHRHGFAGAPVPGLLYTAITKSEDTYYSQEVQILGSGSRFNWVAGLYGGYETGQDDSDVLLLPAVLGPALTSNNNAVLNSNLAAFGQATWEFVPNWHLTGGLRYSLDTRQIDAVALSADQCVVPAPGVESTNPPAPAPPGMAQCPRRFNNTFTQPSWLMSLDTQLTPDILLYAKVAAGYRSGGENEGGAVEVETFAPFAAETNLEYETGIKSEFFHRRMRLNLDGYRDDYSNLQVTTAFVAADGGFASRVSNAATATIEGVEAEGDMVIAPGLTLHASSAYTCARYNTFTDFIGNRAGEPFAVPKWTWSLSGKYIAPTSLGDLLLELDYDWKSSIDFDGTTAARSLVTQAPVGLLDARVNLHVDAWNMDVAAFGKNITAERYSDQAFSLQSLGFYIGYASAPAIFGLEVTKRFGK